MARQPGRPTKLDSDHRRRIIACHRAGLTLADTARAVRISRQTLHTWRTQDPILADALGVPQPADGPAECRGCGVVFEREKGRRFCSPTCRRAVQSEAQLAMYRLAVGAGLVREGMAHFRALVLYLTDRDGTDCGICGETVDITLRSGPRGDGDGPSLDHVVPRSQGGEDTLANLRLTHWLCNRNRGNRGGNEQLRLLG